MFRQLTDHIYVSPQITVEDIAQAKTLGVSAIINNRPEGESPDQTPGDVIEAAAKAAGMFYAAIPVSHSGFAQWQMEEMKKALDAAGDGKLLAYCRSGTRSTFLWALTRAQAGDDAEALAEAAAKAGYDLSPVRMIMDTLGAK